MPIQQIKYELQNILSGKSGSSHDAIIQTIASYLRTGKNAGPLAEEKHQNKAKETEKLTQFAIDNQLLFTSSSTDLLGFEPYMDSIETNKVQII